MTLKERLDDIDSDWYGGVFVGLVWGTLILLIALTMSYCSANEKCVDGCKSLQKDEVKLECMKEC